MQLIAPGHASGGQKPQVRHQLLSLRVIYAPATLVLRNPIEPREPIEYSPQPVLLHAGLVRRRRWAVLELRIEQSVRRSPAPAAGPPAAPPEVHAGAQADSQAALATRRRHPPGGATHRHQNDANS